MSRNVEVFEGDVKRTSHLQRHSRDKSIATKNQKAKKQRTKTSQMRLEKQCQ
jgi:hypothetical protein